VKIDVEGAEWALLPNLFVSGLVCIADKYFVEFHWMTVTGKHPHDAAIFENDINFLIENSGEPACNGTEISTLDDETYSNSNMPLPGNIPWRHTDSSRANFRLLLEKKQYTEMTAAYASFQELMGSNGNKRQLRFKA
jgi:hypothetical protein